MTLSSETPAPESAQSEKSRLKDADAGRAGAARRTVAGLAAFAALLLLSAGAFGEVAAEGGSLLASFDELRAYVAEEAGAGRLPAGTAAAAEALSFELERDLIRYNAEIEILRLEIVRFDGEAQGRSLDRLIAAVAARERRAADSIRRLEALTGKPARAGLLEPVVSQAPGQALRDESPDTATDSEEGARVEITFEAQDLTEDPDP